MLQFRIFKNREAYKLDYKIRELFTLMCLKKEIYLSESKQNLKRLKTLLLFVNNLLHLYDILTI